MNAHAHVRNAAVLASIAALIGAIAAVLASAASSAPVASKVLLESTLSFDAKASTITLPLLRGRSASGGAIWYVVTDSSDRADARRRGINFAPKLRNALGTRAVQRGRLAGGAVAFVGTVNFRPKTVVEPGADGFPPATVKPGALGDARYSPLVTTGNGIVLNASHVANATGTSDSVVSIDRKRGRVTLRTLTGFFTGQTVHYLRTDASVDVVSALEGSTLARNLDAAPGLGSNSASSARSAIIPIVNGPRGKSNRARQGLQSAVLGEGSPLNITQSLPGGRDYSPIWDVHPAVWSEEAVSSGDRKRLTSSVQVAVEVQAGRLTSGGTGPANASLGGLKAADFISNCPTVAVGS